MTKWFFLLAVISIGLAQEEVVKPSFRIVAPQVICTDIKDSNAEKPKQITISMQTQGGQLLKYRVQIFFEVLGGFRGQQHSLKLWDSVRRLERKINTKDTMIISQKNQINVNNVELTSGVYYTFKIVGIDEKGVFSDSQNYTVTFSDGKIKRTNPDGTIIPDGVSFQLLGAENTYADVEYMIEAFVSFCEQRYDYLYKWEISGLTTEQADWTRIPGHILRIPAGRLRGGGLHKISVSLLQSNDSSIIIYQSITVKVLERGFTVSLVPEGLSLGISKPIEFNLHYHDFDNTGEKPQIEWICEWAASAEPCPNFEASDNFVQAAEFYSKGDYVISAMVTLANTSKLVRSTIRVDPDIIVKTVFREATLQDIPSGHGFQLETTIDDLIPNCRAKWIVVNETEYEYFDAAIFPNGLGNLTVLDMEGNFLSELVDYANTTISRDILLNVPDVNEELGWLGLKPNAKYKFRLITTCPAPISDGDDLPTELVSSFVDVTVSTNQPPIGQVLEVIPLNGTALKTIFKISTGVAGDLDTDYPLKYTFQCQVDGFTINLGEYYDNMVTSAILPYSDDQIGTMYEVCDSRSACSILAGPNVTVNAVAISQDEFSNILLQMSSSIGRMEYENALKVALIAGISFKNMKDTQKFEELQRYTNKLIAAEIGRLQERRDDPQYYLPRAVIVSFVRSAQKTMSIFSETEENLQNLVELLSSTTFRITNEDTPTRKRRSVNEKSSYRYDSYIGEIEAHLDVEGSLLNSSNPAIVKAAKYNMTQNVHKHLMGLCKHMTFSPKSFDKPSVEFELRQANRIQLMHNNFTVPMKGEFLPAYVSFNSMLLAGVNGLSRFCVGTIKYPSDYLTGDTGLDGSHETYEILVIKVNSDDEKLVVNLTDVADLQSFDLFVPFYREEEAFTIQCQIFENSSWTSKPCRKASITNNYIKCKCNRVGYFRAIPVGLPVPVEILTTISPNTTAIPIALTVFTESESTAADVTTEWTETEADTMEPSTQLSAVTLPTTVAATIEETTTMMSLSTRIVTTQIATTDLSLAIPDKSSVTIALQPIVSTIFPQKENLTMIESGIKGVSSASVAGFVLAGIFLVLGLSIGIGMYVYYRRSKTNTLAQQMDVIASEIRESTPGIKYARFHDENTMRGDYHSETLFNAQ